MTTSPPVDQHEIRYWTTEDFNVIEYRLLYHLNTKWDALYPDNKGGADLTDQWQVFRAGHFEGRYDGWNKIRHGMVAGGRPRHSTRMEALAAVRKHLGRAISQTESKLADLQEKLTTVARELEGKA